MAIGLPGSVLVLGLGGSPALMVTLGYGVGAYVPPPTGDNNAGDGESAADKTRRKQQRYYIKHRGEILLFDTEADALAWLDAQQEADRAIAQAQKTSRGAKRRMREKVQRQAGIRSPEPLLPVAQLSAILGRFDAPLPVLDLRGYISMHDIAQMQALAAQAQEDDDIALLLLAL